MKDELGKKIRKEFVALRQRLYSYPTDDSKKKAKDIKKCMIKCGIIFEDFKICVENNERTLKSQQRFRSEAGNILTKKVNKIALSGSNSKGLETHDGVISWPYDTGTGKVCKAELFIILKNKKNEYKY